MSEKEKESIKNALGKILSDDAKPKMVSHRVCPRPLKEGRKSVFHACKKNTTQETNSLGPKTPILKAKPTSKNEKG